MVLVLGVWNLQSRLSFTITKDITREDEQEHKEKGTGIIICVTV